MDPVIRIQFALPEIRALGGFSLSTKLLAESRAYRDYQSLAFIDPALTKDASVAGLFGTVLPNDNQLRLELAVELSEFWPDIEDKSEALVTVADMSGCDRQLCISNRFGRYHWCEGNSTWHCITPRNTSAHGGMELEHPKGVIRQATEELLRTVVAMTFDITGTSAEEAFEASIVNCIEVFFYCANRFQLALTTTMSGFKPSLGPLSRDAVSHLYVLVSNSLGVSESAILMVKGSRFFMSPSAVAGDDARRLRKLVAGVETLEDIDLLLGQADISLENGWYEFAFLQTVIAAELCTARTVRTHCIARGVSNVKLREQRDNMTYAWLLNIGLPLMLEEHDRPSEMLVGAMNAARKKRNELMHDGAFSMSRDEVRTLLLNTREFIRCLRK